MIRYAMGAAALLLSACQPVYETRYALTPPGTTEGQICVNSCRQIEQLCVQNAELRYQACYADARAEATAAYFTYLQKQQAAGQPALRELSEFVDARACRSPATAAGACEAEYRACYAACGGSVTPTTVCTAFCD